MQGILNKDIDEIYEAVGCEHCHNGYKGRLAIQEVLDINQEIKDALSMNVRKGKLKDLIYTNDVTTLLQDGLEKAVQGQTTIEEILKLIEIDEIESEAKQKNKKPNIENNTDKLVVTKKEEEKEPTLNDVVTKSIDDDLYTSF